MTIAIGVALWCAHLLSITIVLHRCTGGGCNSRKDTSRKTRTDRRALISQASKMSISQLIDPFFCRDVCHLRSIVCLWFGICQPAESLDIAAPALSARYPRADEAGSEGALECDLKDFKQVMLMQTDM